ncbi:MAG: phospholipid:lipid A palmitoyltransferase [Betaproteobacteria bacterium]|nr:phospholipid:lipid A palmitoyltransferase [Betaproteobacteria bacterium]
MLQLCKQALYGLPGVFLCFFAHAQETPLDSTSTTTDAPWYASAWNTAVARTTDIVTNGGWDFYQPVRTYHMPFAYTAEQRDRYNDVPLPGFGIGRGKFLDNGNWEGIYAMGFRDSNSKPSWMAGYAYRWLWDAPSINAHYGVGATAFLMSREDYFDYFPFPAILPMVTLGFRNVSFEATYVPGKRGNGNVLFMWLKLEEKERPHL